MALPAHIPPSAAAAIHEAHRRLRDLYGERLERVVLYGSHARGDAHEESDVDLLVVLHDTVDAHAELRRLAAVTMDVLVEYGEDVSMQPYGAEEVRRAARPFLATVTREGVPL